MRMEHLMMKSNSRLTILFALALLCAAPILAQKKSNLEKPMAGPRATPLRVSILYVAPDPGSQKLDRVQIGREMVVAEKSGPWLRVYANTDIQEARQKDSRRLHPGFNRHLKSRPERADDFRLCDLESAS